MVKKYVACRIPFEAYENLKLKKTKMESLVKKITGKNKKQIKTEDENIDFMNFEISARDYKNIEEYLSDLNNYVENNRK